MASKFLLSVKGAKQGDLKGETGKNSNKIPILGFSYGVSSPREIGSGQGTGKRQHKPLKVFKEWGVISVQLFQALVTNEQLTSVVIEEMRTDAQGKEEVYMEIRLSRAAVSEIEIKPERIEVQPVWMDQEIEQVEFIFEKIEIENKDSKTTAADDWRPLAGNKNPFLP